MNKLITNGTESKKRKTSEITKIRPEEGIMRNIRDGDRKR